MNEPTEGQCRCGERGASRLHLAECEFRAALLESVLGQTASLDQCPSRVAIADLMAHLDTVYADGRNAARAAVRILELGWRPVVGGKA